MQLCRRPGTTHRKTRSNNSQVLALAFALECIINRGEAWAVYNPNLPGDRNNDVMAKVYFER